MLMPPQSYPPGCDRHISHCLTAQITAVLITSIPPFSFFLCLRLKHSSQTQTYSQTASTNILRSVPELQFTYVRIITQLLQL